MSAAGNRRTPAKRGAPLSWLESPQPYTTTTAPGGGTAVECREDVFDVVITEPPPGGELQIVVHGRLRLRAAPGIDTTGACLLHLIADDAKPTASDVGPDFVGIACSARPPQGNQHQHQLRVPAKTHIAIRSGDWQLDAHPATLDEHEGLVVVVDNQQTPLRISCTASLNHLVSSGDHEFDLAEPRATSAISVNAGTATLRQPIERAKMSGAGKLRTLGQVSGCRFVMDGSVEAHSTIETTEIILGGDFESSASVALDGQRFECRNATLHGDLKTDGLVRCDKLEVHGHIESTGAITARELRCAGSISAERLAIIGSIEVPGS